VAGTAAGVPKRPVQASAECSKRRNVGSNSGSTASIAASASDAVAGPSPYTAGLVTQRPALGCLFEIVETLVLTLIIFFVIQNFIAQPYQVKQQSMERTLEPDQYVLVDKLTPRFDAYARGEIIVFTPPEDWSQGDGTPFIKRIIGIGGDTIEIRDGQVYVNGVALEETYLYAGATGIPEPTLTTIDPPLWDVPIGELFVMGDHRSHSADSRAFGPIPVDSVVGRAWLRYWPFETIGILDSPTYPGLQLAVP